MTMTVCEAVRPLGGTNWSQMHLIPDLHAEAFEHFRRKGVAYQRAIRELQAVYEPRTVLPNLTACSVAPITRREAKTVILKYEWLRTMGRAVACYGLWSPEQELLGVTCFGWPAAPESRDVCGRAERDAAVCLERGACVHWAPPNAASYLIREAVKQAHRDHGWEIFYAYADEDAGEIGTVYQASNWHYLGQGLGRTPGRMREDFRDPDGNVISGRALRHRGLRKSEILQQGWTVVYRYPKHKYVWFEGRRRHTLKLKCRYPFQPYPKRAEGVGETSQAHQPEGDGAMPSLRSAQGL